MSAAALPATEPTPQPEAADPPSHAARLLTLVRRLIDYAKDLAAAYQQPSAIARFPLQVRRFGTTDIVAILARITSGLLRAEALEARLLRAARRPDAAPEPVAEPPGAEQPKPAGEPRPRAPRVAPDAAFARQHPLLAILPSPERIAAEVGHRPIGAVLVDICCELGILADHPLWRELVRLITWFGGSLVKLYKDIDRHLFPAAERIAAEYAARRPGRAPSPAMGGTGPP